MKKFQLSTPAERMVGITFSVIISAALVFLLFALRNNMAVLLLTAVGVGVVVFVFALYVLNVAKAACIPDPESKTLRVTGVRERNIDLSRAAYLQTIPVKSGHIESRSLAFTDAEDKVLAIVPTYFTSRRGVLAEPLAKELAQVLNLEFVEKVPVWEYDKEARKAHDIEVEQQEKEAAKADREARKALRAAKLRKRMEQMRQEDNKS